MDKYTVTFYPDNKKVVVDKGSTILSSAISAHIHLNSSCGGDGVCGHCKVLVKKGKVHSELSGAISADDKKRGLHLACQALVESDVEVEIPKEARLDLGTLSKEELELRFRGLYGRPEDVSEAKLFVREDFLDGIPLVTKYYLDLPRPSFDDKISDFERICRALDERIGEKPIYTGLSNIRHLGELLRACDWKVTVTVARKIDQFEIICVEPQDRSGNNFGFAFDIGTTTISGQLVDLNHKKVLGTKATYNRQVTYGSDVISRIIYARAENGLEKLNNAVIDCLNEMIEILCQENSVDMNDVTCLSVAGNTTMMHLLLRIDPSYIRQEPYVPTANFFPVYKAADCGININPHGLLYCLPGVASYVGADITSGIVACNINESLDLNLLIDIGTNGEIALGNKDWIVSCAASAGPAFEGSGMSCGLRATKGAIQEAKINAKTLDVEYKTIESAKPKGICGSGYIDLLCQMLDNVIIDKNGRLNRDLKNKRIREGKNGYEFVVAFANETDTGSDIIVSEADLDNLKRAKAAIYSGVAILVKHLGLKFDDIKKIYIAGGFGASLNIESSIKIGLIPDLPRQKYCFAGNTSLFGSRLSLLSTKILDKCNDVAKNVTYFELSNDPAYMDEYMAALFFPHTDITRFPSLK